MVRERSIRVLTLVLLAVLSFGICALHVHVYTKVSPIDELQHIDYLYRAPLSPAPGDKVGQDAMREQTCRGIDVPGANEPGCTAGAVYDPNVFQEGGYNTAAINPPVYYSLTRLVAAPLRAVAGLDSLVTAGRLAGGIWLALGLCLTYLTALRRGVDRWAALAMISLMAASPALVFPSATINPDAAALAGGALLVYLMTRWEESPSRWKGMALVIACGLVASVKMTHVLAVLAVALYLLLHNSAGRSGWSLVKDPAVRLGACCGAVGGLAIGGWLFFQSLRPQIDSENPPAMTQRLLVPDFPWLGLIESPLSMVTPLASPWLAVGDPLLLKLATAVASLILVAGVLAAGLFAAADSASTRLAVATLFATVVCSVGLVVANYWLAATYFELPGRYAAAAVSPMVICAAGALRSRTAVALVQGLALMCLTMTIARIWILA